MQNFIEAVRPMGWELDGYVDRVNKSANNKFGGLPCTVALEQRLG